MSEASAATRRKLTPLQDFKRVYCEGCKERETCRHIKMRWCIAAEELRGKAMARQQPEVFGR